jgi:hypothetical protein
VLERTVQRMEKYLRRLKILTTEARDDGPEAALIESAVSGQTPPAGPQWLRGLAPLAPNALRFDKPLCASLDGFTLHAATRAGGLDVDGREALLRYVLRPPFAQDRLEQRPDGLVRLALKRAYAEGTIERRSHLGFRARWPELHRQLDDGRWPAVLDRLPLKSAHP